MGTWHPWKEIGERYPDVAVSRDYRLPPGVRAMWKDATIWLCSTLTQAERRSALTHELQHLARGLVEKPWRQREERIVDELAARRLIELPDLIDALRCTGDVHQLADELWTDVYTVETRMATLDPVEVAQLEHELGDLWIP